MRYYLIVLIALLMSVSLVAAPYSMVASEIGASAKTIGRGYVEGYGQRAHSVFENPATLTTINRGSIGVFSTTLMNEISYRNIALAVPTPVGTLGAGFMEAVSYEIPFTSESGGRFYEEDWFDWRDAMSKLSVQNDILDWLSLGATYVSYKRSFYTISATGWDMELGAFCDFDWIQASLVARNVLGRSVTYVDAVDDTYSENEALPFQGIASIKVSWSALQVMTQVKVIPNYQLSFYALEYKPPFMPSVTFRIGNRDVLVKQTIKNSLTAGFGMDIWGLMVDVAYEKSDYFEFDHKIYMSLGLDF